MSLRNSGSGFSIPLVTTKCIPVIPEEAISPDTIAGGIEILLLNRRGNSSLGGWVAAILRGITKIGIQYLGFLQAASVHVACTTEILLSRNELYK